MFWKFQKIHEQLLLKDIEKLEALSETVQKIHDLKKASVGKIHKGISRYYLKKSIEWPLLLDNINVDSSTVSVSSCPLCKPFA